MKVFALIQRFCASRMLCLRDISYTHLSPRLSPSYSTMIAFTQLCESLNHTHNPLHYPETQCENRFQSITILINPCKSRRSHPVTPSMRNNTQKHSNRSIHTHPHQIQTPSFFQHRTLIIPLPQPFLLLSRTAHIDHSPTPRKPSPITRTTNAAILRSIRYVTVLGCSEPGAAKAEGKMRGDDRAKVEMQFAVGGVEQYRKAVFAACGMGEWGG